jgi:hypothetical protein
VAPGVVIVVAAWMLDPVACAGMVFGAPRVILSALIELHQLLIEHGFRRSSRDDSTIVQEEQNEEPAGIGAAVYGPTPAQHAVRFGKATEDRISPADRNTVLARLASLLLEAAGFAAGERTDDEH